MKKLLIALVLAIVLSLATVMPAFAQSTADVTVTATPSYISISVNPAVYNFGSVVESATPTTAQGYFTITNTSSITTNSTISVTTANWTGGAQWIHNDSGAPGAVAAALKASDNDSAWDVIVKYNAVFNILATNTAANTNWQWELKLYAPTSFTDGVQKQIVVRITASG